MFTDTHCHIYNEYYDNNVEQVYEKMKLANVDRIINNGCDSASNNEVLELLGKYSWMYGALGIHPESADSYTDEDLRFIEEHINDERVVAVGEIGLDYHYDNTDKEKQYDVLKRQLDIAIKHNKPIIFHSRDAIGDTYNILKEYKLRGSIHCYSGSVEMAREFTKFGYMIGVGGVVTYKNGRVLKEVVKDTDLSYILLETDAPYLCPEPYRGMKNDSSYIPELAKVIAELKDISIAEVSSVTTDNVERLFDFSTK
jgi:TatD DNase family protein